MKKTFFNIFLLICSVTFIISAFLPVAATASEVLPAESSSGNETATYYYDRINERQQWCYNYLKDYYDNFSGEPGYYTFDLSHLLPEGSTEEEYNQLGRDFIIGELALLADHPLYKMKGEVEGFGCDTTGESSGIPGKIAFMLFIVHQDLLTEDTKLQTAARIDQIVATVGEGDRYTKLRKLTDYLLSNTFYDPYLDAINLGGHRNYALATRGHHYNQSCYGLFLENIAVCEGFCHAVKVLCDKLDIPCIIIGNKSHAWNLVQMEDGSWYTLDITNACRLGRDGELPSTLDLYFAETFLNNNSLQHFFGFYNDPYMISLNEVRYVTDFPELAEGQYKYTGDTKDFSYTVVSSTYTPGEPTFSYSVNPDGKTCTITNYEGKEEGDLIIPETIDGYTVTAIEAYAFYYCTEFTGKLVIPDTVETIGKAAFAGCCNLTSVELPENLRKLERGTFAGCKGLTEIALPDLIGEISEYVFYDCDKLNRVTFGAHILSIGEMAFGEIGAELVIKAPAGSDAQQYASANNISFEASGDLCAFRDVDGEWEFDDDGHFHTCEHGGRFDLQAHTNEKGYFNCGDRCDVCNAQRCNKLGFMESVEVLVNAHPATCVSAEYTGDLGCICGNIWFWLGEYTGTPTGVHTPDVEGWKYNEYNHYQNCSVCDQMIQEARHCGGTATETQRAVCEVCGAEYGELLPPTSETEAPDISAPEEEAKTDVTENDSDNGENVGCASTLSVGEIGMMTMVAVGYVILKKRKITR